mmetsp:Transcript_75606/g.194836  ORF Transcript_75606/g.194836 Transcript_75606/m.194836 type:complete len:174 (+) Transcript_75606:405-926(+)
MTKLRQSPCDLLLSCRPSTDCHTTHARTHVLQLQLSVRKTIRHCGVLTEGTSTVHFDNLEVLLLRLYSQLELRTITGMVALLRLKCYQAFSQPLFDTLNVCESRLSTRLRVSCFLPRLSRHGLDRIDSASGMVFHRYSRSIRSSNASIELLMHTLESLQFGSQRCSPNTAFHA